MEVHPVADLFPMLADDELAELAADIKTHGLHEPLWLYDDPQLGLVLLDGRNRLAACKIAGVEPTTRKYTGDTPWQFAISENVRRRHLTTGQQASIAYRSLPGITAEVKAIEAERQRKAIEAQRSKPEADRPQVKKDEPRSKRAPQSRDKAAKAAGTSGRSVARYQRIAEKAPDLTGQVDAGTLALDRADRIIRDREAEAKRVEQARKEAAAQPKPSTFDIRLGDFREVLADLTDVDAIITDPPYPKEFLPLLADLAIWADKVLKPDGILVVLFGQTYLPEVYRLLDGGRPYRWTGCYLTSGQGYVSHARKVQSNWKPLLIYGGGSRFADVIRTEGTDADAKNNHKWGQDYGAFHTLIERMTIRGQTVVDPFMGSGTTLLAAHALGRNVVGCDIDESHVDMARKRLA